MAQKWTHPNVSNLARIACFKQIFKTSSKCARARAIEEGREREREGRRRRMTGGGKKCSKTNRVKYHQHLSAQDRSRLNGNQPCDCCSQCHLVCFSFDLNESASAKRMSAFRCQLSSSVQMCCSSQYHYSFWWLSAIHHLSSSARRSRPRFSNKSDESSGRVYANKYEMEMISLNNGRGRGIISLDANPLRINCIRSAAILLVRENCFDFVSKCGRARVIGAGLRCGQDAS